MLAENVLSARLNILFAAGKVFYREVSNHFLPENISRYTVYENESI